MRFSHACLPLLALLPACNAMHDSVTHANENLYQGGAATRQRIASAIYDDDIQKLPPAPDAQRYCYDVRADILCYDQPQPDLRKAVGARGYGRDNAPSQYDGSYVANPPAGSMTASRSSTSYSGSGAYSAQAETYVSEAPPVAGDGDAPGAPQSLMGR